MNNYAYFSIKISIVGKELSVSFLISKEEFDLVEKNKSGKILEQRILDQWEEDYYDNVKGGFITDEEHYEPLEILWDTYNIY